MLVVLDKRFLDGNNGESLGQDIYCIKNQVKMLLFTMFQ